VATDVAARGIDVDDLTHVINYNLPDSLETYVHRSGRTGRANKTGICVTIINAREGGRIRQLERMIERKIEYKSIPGGSEICNRRLFNLIDEVEKVKVDEEQISEFLPDIYAKLSEMSREDLITKFVSVEFNRFLEYYKNAPDLNVSHQKKESGRPERKSRRNESSFTRYFINIGKDHNLNPSELITLINQTLPGEKLDIGNIDLQSNFSFFEIEEGHEEKVIKSFKFAKFRKHKVNVELATPKPSNRSGGGRGGYKKGGFKKDDRKRSSRRRF
jgi:ATP-dependent RNA helicase DeaD